MAEFNQFDELDGYVSNCSAEENQRVATSKGLVNSIDWTLFERELGLFTPSHSMRAQEQGPFDSMMTDDQVQELVDVMAPPIEQATVCNGISYYPNQMGGYSFGYAETSASIPMEYEPDFFLPEEEFQQPMSEIGDAAVAPPHQVETPYHEKDWPVRDEHTGKIRPPLLYEYLRKLLDDPQFSHVATYVDAQRGIFKFHDKDMAAKLWQEAKQRNCDSG